MLKRSLVFTLIVLLFGLGVLTNGASMSGSWENELTLTPQTGSFFSGDEGDTDGTKSILTIEYIMDGYYWESESEFSLDGYSEQNFELGGTIGLIDLVSELEFNPQAARLDSWEGTANFTAAGLSVSDTLILKNETDYEGFGAGMELSFSGGTPYGISVDVDSYFGMDSGENIITSHNGQTGSYGPSAFQYVSTEIDISGLTLDCCEFDSETKFSEEKGFEYTEFDFEILSDTWPLSLDGELKFQTYSKSIELDPSLDLSWTCFDVYTKLDTTLGNGKPDLNQDSLGGLTVEGFSLSDVEMGHVTFSSYTALYGHTVADLDGSFLGSYTFTADDDKKSVELDEVFRIEKDDRLSLVVDVYFDMSGQNGSLFDLALVNGEAMFEMSDQFDFGAEVFLLPNHGLDQVGVTLDYFF